MKLDWVPKPFGPGDMDGDGALKLLGQFEIDRPTLLIRETAQNSWDAALDTAVPEFEVSIHRLSAEELHLLRTQILTGEASGLGLRETLDRESFRVIEIADRNTTGLGGPTRNDIPVADGVSADFMNFVLSLGAPRDTDLGGGTYGFGKTASYVSSGCGTVLIWTRTGNAGILEHRLIGSAMGHSFQHSGHRYTGRHWWGRKLQNDYGNIVVQPALGEDARILGNKIFHRDFDGDETGTSLLILDPHPEIEDDGELAEIIRQAVIGNLWPKMSQAQPSDRQMRISLLLHGDRVPLVTPADDAVLEAKVRCLSAVRQAQTGSSASDPAVELTPIKRYRSVIGHLATTRLPKQPLDGSVLPVNTVTLMRHRAELVVRDNSYGELPDGLFDWVGVFKPVANVDDSFAAAEPPSHDNWFFEGLDKTPASIVRVALNRINDAAKELVTPVQAQARPAETASTGPLSNALAGLVAGVIGGRATNSGKRPRSRGKSSSRRSPRATVAVRRITPLGPDQRFPDEQRIRLELEVRTGMSDQVELFMSRLAYGADGGSVAAEREISVDHWRVDSGAWIEGDTVIARDGSEVICEVLAPIGVTVDLAVGTRDMPCE